MARIAQGSEAEVRSAISAYAAAGRHDPFVLLRSDSLGDRVTVEHRKLAVVVTQPYPTVLQALGRGDPHGRVPVVTDASLHASLRWIDPLAQTPLTSVPAELVEAHVWPAELAELADVAGEREPDEDDVSWVTFPEPVGKPSPEDILNLIEMEVGFDEIDEYLGEMAPDQLSRAIASAGFDPATETKRGIGIREKVVTAIAEKR